MGRPQIAVRDGNYKNRGELFLEHNYSGTELEMRYARDTLVNVHRLWNRPVHLETVLDGTVTTISFDGKDHEVEQHETLDIADEESL
jgi:stage V sporulation protein R